METKYYCKNCDEHFSENTLPNMNRRHRCGELVRIVGHDPHDAHAASEEEN
jgi:hypothetical protein